MSPRPLTPQVVALPWATVHWPEPAVSPEATSVGPVKASLSPGLPRLPASPHESPARAEGSRRGARFRPEPVVPPAHRRPLDTDQLNSAAVVLDVLGSWTGGVTGRPTVLHELTGVMVRLGELGDASEERQRALVEFAASDVGTTRAVLSRALSAHLSAVAGAEPAAPSTPAAVGTALRRLEAMGRAVVREARLLIEARDGTDYRQA
jgi:hypothetical protein